MSDVAAHPSERPGWSFWSFLIRGHQDAYEGWDRIRARLLTALVGLVPLCIVAFVQVALVHGLWPRGVLILFGAGILAAPAVLLWRGASIRWVSALLVGAYLSLALAGILFAGGLGTATGHHLAPWLMITMMLFGRRAGVAAGLLSTAIVLACGYWSMHHPYPSVVALPPSEIATTMRSMVVTTWVVFGFLMMYEAQRASNERRLVLEARHDDLTGLPTRALFNDRLGRAIARADRNGSTVAVFLVDLDDFKAVNDQVGHEAGDRMLVTVAQRIQATIRETDMLARFGGDEFVGFVELDVPSAFGAFERRLTERLRPAVDHRGLSMPIRLSLGHAFYPSEAGAADALLRVADRRMYRSKRTRKGGERGDVVALPTPLSASR